MSKETMEFEGKNTEDAIQSACKHFNTSPDKLDIQILTTGSTGIFGLVGGKKAKVRVTLKEEPKPEELPENLAKEESFDLVLEDETIEPKPAARKFEAEEPTGEEAGEETEEDSFEEEEDEEESATGPDMEETQAALETGKEALEKILGYLDENSNVSAEIRNTTVVLNIEGESGGILIGKKGKTLDALQYIISKVVNKQSNKKIKVMVDTENYRQRHRKSLEDLAKRLGEKVKRTGKPVTISPMNPADRRIVHLALQNDKSLRTRSKGEGVLKKIIIFPQRSSSESRRNSNA